MGLTLSGGPMSFTPGPACGTLAGIEGMYKRLDVLVILYAPFATFFQS
jgi:hypothetical protein